MTQQQLQNKLALLKVAAIAVDALGLQTQGLSHADAEAYIITENERMYNFYLRAVLPNSATVAETQTDGTVKQVPAHPPGVYDDPPDVDPVAVLTQAANNPVLLSGLTGNPTALAGIVKAIAPFLALIPGPAGVAASAAATTLAQLQAMPPIPMPSKPA